MLKNYSMTSTRTNRWRIPLMFLLGIGLTIMTSLVSYSQVSYTQNWSTTTPTALQGWTNATGGGTGARTTTGACADGSIRKNQYGTGNNANWLFVSPSTGTSTGFPTTVSFSYKVVNFSGLGATPNTPNWGTIAVQWGTSSTGPWTTVGTINNTNHISSASCANASYSFTPTSGNAVFIRFNCNFPGGTPDYYVYLDNVSVQETVPPCSGTPSGGTTTGNLTSGCNGASFTLNVTGSGFSPGITYQWFSSPDNVSFSPISGATAATYSSLALSNLYYYRQTTCTNSGLSAVSTTVQNTVSGPVAAPYTEPFNTYPPACWIEATGLAAAPSTVVAGANNWGGSAFGNTGANQGFKINLYGTNNAWVISPVIDLGAGNKRLKYRYAVTGYNATTTVADLGSHIVRVIISTDGGLTWTTANTLATYTGAAAYSATGTDVTLNLTQSGNVRFAFVASTTATSPDIDFHIDDFVVEEIPPLCSGTPVGGTTGGASGVCSGVSFTLNVTGATSGVEGLTYEWETSPDGVSWSPTGVTTLTYTSAITTSTYFRRRITCAGNNEWSSPLQLTINAPTACYCTPTAVYGCADGDVIARLQLNTLDNNSGTGCPSDPNPFDSSFLPNVQGPGYSDYTGNPLLTTQLAAGGSYSCTVFAGQYSENYAVWIDYNDDGVFSTPSERVGATASAVAGSGSVGVLGSSASFPIVLACNPPLGIHRLRVRCVFGVANGAAILPCGQVNYGETEDYLIEITTAVPCPAPTNLAANNVTTTGVDLSWTIGCAETVWAVEYGPQGFTPGTGIFVDDVFTNPYSLSGLLPATNYSVYVYAKCGPSLYSSAFGPVNFQTLIPPPTNDDCLTAVDLGALTSPYTSTTTGLLANVTTVCGAPAAEDGVLFIDVPNNFILTIGQTSNAYDSEISVAYGGACPGTTQLACFDEPDIQNITFNNNTGSLQRVYWVQGGWISGAAGAYTLAWSLAPAPACGAPTVTNGTTTAFTHPFTVTPSIWGTPTGYEYEVGLTGFTPTGVGTAFAGPSATITGLTASTGYQYYVRSNCGGTFSAWVGPLSFTTTPPPPSNDDCANAITINCAASPVTGTTVNSTVDANYVAAGPNLGDNTTERGVWYRIVGDDQEYTITNCQDPSPFFDSRITVFEGTCSGLVPIVGNDDWSGCSSYTLSSRVVFSAFAGTDYYVFVHGYQFGTALSATGPFQLTITCAPACVPQTYNQCANAVALTPNVTCVNQSFTTLCATPTIGLANPAGVSVFATYTDSWFTVTPTTNDFYIQFTYGTAAGLRYTFYSGVCGTLTQLAPNNLITSGVEYGIFGATAGQTYYVRVGNDGNGTDGTFDVCVRSLPCSTPASATVTATSNTNVNVVINGGTAGDAYIIEYGPQGHIPGVAGVAGAGGTIVTTNTLNTNVPVAANQNYTFFVRKDCSGTAEGYSFNVGPYNVNTFTVVPTTGTQTLTTCNTVIYDSGTTNNYLASNTGVLIVQPTSASALMTFVGNYAGIETCCDDLNIYQGSGTGGTLLGTYNGTGTFNIQSTIPGSALTIQFLSDGSVQGAGFDITAQCQEVCTSLPVAMPVTGPSSVCLGQSFTLAVANPSIGYTYQWQRFTSTGWVDILGATNASYTGTQTTATTYRCRIGCTFTVNPLSTTPTQVRTVTMNAPSVCYCTPVSQSNGTDNVDFVELGEISNFTGANPTSYTLYPATPGLTTTILQGGTYQINIGAGSYFSNFLAAWIDFNRNGVFESSEKLGESAVGAFGTTTFTFTVPSNALIGGSRLRVRDEDASIIDPCINGSSFGETEDYVVTLAQGSSNDAFANAAPVAPAVFPGCTNITGNLANATPTIGETGNDLWYSFTAASNAVRIQLTGAQDCELEVYNAAQVELATENATSSNGNEVLAVGSLTPGTQYWVRIHSLNVNPTTFSCCIQTLNDSRCDNGPTFTGLCSNFKVDWTGTGSYVARFTDLVDSQVYTHNFVSGTSVQLVNVPGLRHDRSYSVAVDAIYTVVDAGGNTSTVTATSNETCNITINQHPLVNLRNIDRDPATRAIGAFIATDIVVCGIIGWSWNFELVDASGNSIDINPGDNEVTTSTTSRFIRTSQIPGVQPGDRYRVMVRPRFSYGSGVYDTGNSYFLKIAGSANSVEVEEGVVVNPEEMYFERNAANGVSAAIYPNPNNGDMVNLNLAGIDSENVQIRIMDATGRLVWSNRYVVDGALNTIIAFDRPLPSGIYMVEMTYNNEVITERMMVTK